MKTLSTSNHSIVQYASRTGRNSNIVSALIGSIRCGREITYKEALNRGFNLTKIFKNDIYFVWFDGKINEELLAIISWDGCIKTVLSKKMYGFINKGKKVRYDNLDKLFIYQFERKY